MRKKLLTFLLAITPAATIQAQKLSINTDLAMDALTIPNLGMEITCGERSTFTLNLLGSYHPWWSSESKMFGFQPELRYYFSGRPLNSWFAGLGGIAGFYDMTMHGKVYNGLAYGAGLTIGYVFKLSSRWNIDAHAGFGCIGYNRKEYYVGDNYDIDYAVGDNLRTNATGYYLMPTRIGVSITYIIK